jgi:hypothetical protein
VTTSVQFAATLVPSTFRPFHDNVLHCLTLIPGNRLFSYPSSRDYSLPTNGFRRVSLTEVNVVFSLIIFVLSFYYHLRFNLSVWLVVCWDCITISPPPKTNGVRGITGTAGFMFQDRLDVLCYAGAHPSPKTASHSDQQSYYNNQSNDADRGDILFRGLWKTGIKR